MIPEDYKQYDPVTEADVIGRRLSKTARKICHDSPQGSILPLGCTNSASKLRRAPAGELDAVPGRSVHRHGWHIPVHSKADVGFADCLVQLCALCHVALQRRTWHPSDGPASGV